MTLAGKGQSAHVAQQGHDDRPDSAGRAQQARRRAGAQRHRLPDGAVRVVARRTSNRIQRIAVKESRLGIPVVIRPRTSSTATGPSFPCRSVSTATLRSRPMRAAPRASRASKVTRTASAGRSRRWLDHPFDPRWGRVVETFGESPLVSERLRASRRCSGFHRLARADCRESPRPRISASRAASSTISATAPSQGGKDYAYVDLTGAQHPRISSAAVRGRHRGRRAVGDAGVHDRAAAACQCRPTNACSQDVLRGELGFDGVLVSDYAGITEMRNHGTAADDLEAAVQALRDGTMTVDMEDGVYYAQLARAVTDGTAAASRRSIAKCCARSPSSGSSACSRSPTCPRTSRSACACPRRIAPPRARSRANPSCCSRTTRTCCR